MRRAAPDNGLALPGIRVGALLFRGAQVADGLRSGRMVREGVILPANTVSSRDKRHMTDRPNFLFIMTDQQRADWLGCAGHPVV